MARLPSRSVLPLLALLLLLCMMPLPSSCAASKKPKPKRLNFYMLIVVQNLSLLHNPHAHYTAVRSAAPRVVNKTTSFGVLNTFDNPISKTASLATPADLLGRVQGWYGDCGKDELTLCLAQTFTYDDGQFKGTFSLIGVSVANPNASKETAVVGGTGDFAFCRGVATQHQYKNPVYINNEENNWFSYNIVFKC